MTSNLMNQQNHRIVVGWNESPGAGAALRWAMHQALRTGRGIQVVYDGGDDALGGGAGHPQDDGHSARIAAGLDSITAFWRLQHPEVRIAFSTDSDDPAVGLVRWSDGADILAVGAPPPRPTRLIGSLSAHLCARAESPVALIPAAWDQTAESGPEIVVGVTSSIAGRRALRWAAQEATSSSAPLLVLVGADSRTTEGLAIEILLEDMTSENPGLDVQIHPVVTNPADTLIALSYNAQMVVVGAHHSHDPWSIRLGPVTTAVVSGAHSPVVTVSRLHPQDLEEMRVEPGRPATSISTVSARTAEPALPGHSHGA